MRKLPSIKLLVTFEAAARHLSFKDAANELFVTPSAVSHQVRTLEEALNTTLFIRSNRAIELTQQGQAYFQQISQAIRTIYSATESIMDQSHEQTLLIHSIPYLTNRYIIPNIKSLKSLYPDLKIAIESQVERAQLNEPHQQGLQVGLRHGKTDCDTMLYDEIAPVQISPICSPDYSPDQKLTLIQLSSDSASWDQWQTDWNSTLKFDDVISCDGMQAVIDMTKQGLGIAMGYFPFVNPELSRGSLVLRYPDNVSRLDSLYMVYPEKDRGDPVITALSAWLKTIINA